MSARFFAVGDGAVGLEVEQAGRINVVGAGARVTRAAGLAGGGRGAVWLNGRRGRLREWNDVVEVALLADPPRLALHRVLLAPQPARRIEIVDAASGESTASLVHDVNGALAWSPDGSALWLQRGDALVAVDGVGRDIGSFSAGGLRGSHGVVFAATATTTATATATTATTTTTSAVRALVHGYEGTSFLALVELDGVEGRGRVIERQPVFVRQLAASADLTRAFSVDELRRLTAWQIDGDTMQSRRAETANVERVWCNASGAQLYAATPHRIVGTKGGRLAMCADLDYSIDKTALDADAALAVTIFHGGARIHDLRLGTSEYVREADRAAVTRERALVIVNGALFVSDKRTERAPRVVEGPVNLVDVAVHPRGVVVIDGAGCTHFIDDDELLS